MHSQETVLLTGATGQDGSYLVERLIGEGVQIHALVRKPSTTGALASGSVVEHVGNLENFPALARLIDEVRPDLVFNLAGISSVATSWERPIDTAKVSGAAVVTLLDACWRLQKRTGTDVRFVQASSSEIFGAARVSPQNELTPIQPLSPYGAAKALAHHAVEVYRQRGLLCSSAILYNHESPRRPNTFVTRKITIGAAEIAMGLREKLSLGNLDARRDWGWAPDYVDALLLLARSNQIGDVVVATGETRSVGEFVATAFEHAGVDDWKRYVDVDSRFLRPADVQEMRGDSSKARALLGWKPTRNFHQIVTAMVDHDLALLGH